MCGISGTYAHSKGEADLEPARKMGELMRHRGPDNFGCAKLGKVAMAHNRLSLLDLSDAANQPFRTDRYLLAYNGEIYNFRQIRKRLEEEKGIRLSTTSDTEVLFQSLIVDGIDKCLTQLRGMFAFAFYDAEKDRLILARDRMGIKPLYYFENAGTLYWASEIKAIASVLNLKPDPVRTLFAVNNLAEKSTEFTLFSGLRSVNPGSYVEFRSGGAPRAVRYYDVVEEFDPLYYKELDARPRAEIVSEFDNKFAASVESMLVSDVPVGAFVSGGIDSSLISAIAARKNPEIKLFTANVVGKYSEFPDVEILSKHINCEVFESRFEPEMMLRDWVDVTYHYDCPLVIHVNSIPFSNVARLARDSGVKAVLTGEGADELFLGYPRLLTERYQSAAAFPVNLVKSLYRISPKLHEFLFPRNGATPVAFINKLVQGFELEQLEDNAAKVLSFLGPKQRREQFMTIKMIREHLVTLLHRNDRMGMMSSIEARFPFLDEDIVRFAINLPSKFKIGRSARFHNYKHPFLIDKWIVRRTAEKYLPKEIVTKKKFGFPMYGHKFLNIRSGFFVNGWVAESLDLNRSVQEFLTETQDPYLIAKLASVDIFGRLFYNGQSREEVKEHVFRFAEIVHD
ncbi:MAG: asparagine synthase (glutamine-hydrolyzing) [Acidobacteriota bacterium]|nr:MAG: asparagine synthase (glutamine-hydrolyzing) [Acidobacteriota bacterium]